jgi:hypothetical protein
MIHMYTTHFSFGKKFYFLLPVVCLSILHISCQWYGLFLLSFLTGMTCSGDGEQQARARNIQEKLGSECIWYCGEVHDGLAVGPGKLTAESGSFCQEVQCVTGTS